jgi:hypothetical protein
MKKVNSKHYSNVFIGVCLFLATAVLPSGSFAQRVIDKGMSTCAIQLSSEGRLVAESQMQVLFDKTNLKVTVKSGNGSTIFYIDRVSNKIVSTQEVLGKKLGFYAFDTSETVKKNILSKTTVVETDSTRNINGISCRLLTLKYDPSLKIKDVRVWYDPSRKLFDKNMGLTIPGIELVKGIPVLVVTEARGITTTYSLLSVEESIAIDEDQFKVPASFVITDLPEFQKSVQRLMGGGTEK